MDNEKNENQKLICFICAAELDNIEDWKNHITEDHEEKKEFLLCEYCKVPCRDLPSHWMIHHKDIKMPFFEQERVLKFHDFSKKYRCNNRKKTKWKEGYFDSIKMGKTIHYRSSWERDVMVCLEKCLDIKEYYGDDHFCIKYIIKGHQKNYWPDFTVKTTDGQTIILEIKPENQVDLEINKAKWEYAQQFCKQRQWEFQVWTQNHIKKIKMRALRKDVLLKEHIIPDNKEE